MFPSILEKILIDNDVDCSLGIYHQLVQNPQSVEGGQNQEEHVIYRDNICRAVKLLNLGLTMDHISSVQNLCFSHIFW